MITALASDYTSVYYVDLDTDESICYSSKVTPEDGPQVGDNFLSARASPDMQTNVLQRATARDFSISSDPKTSKSGLRLNR